MISKELLDDLRKKDIPQYDIEYIISVVNYIDEQMQVPADKTATIKDQTNKMIELVERIKQAQTGIDIIDEIKNHRYEQARILPYKQAETMPYVNNYISVLSENGGLFRYVNEGEYKVELTEKDTIQPETAIKSKDQRKQELLEDLRKEDIPKYEIEYILSVVNYIDEHMQIPADKTATIGTQIDKMIELVEKIKQAQTGIDVIDEIKNHRYNQTGTIPYVNNYISTLSENGGLFRYVNERSFERSSSEIKGLFKKAMEHITGKDIGDAINARNGREEQTYNK